MNFPKLKLNSTTYATITQNKTGDMAQVYKPLQNFINSGTLSTFTSELFNFDRHDQQDLIITDEFDGSTNIIINDGKNEPRLINSGFAVQENNTFLIPEHYTNSVNNIYEDSTFSQDVQLFKLYNKVPKLEFKGLSSGGFKCGSYIFYFRLADSYGNLSNVIQHSSIVQIHVGEVESYQIRMGMQDEQAGKSVKFKLTGLDSGYDYIRVFYERTSSSSDQATTTLFYMIDQNFPIINGESDLIITGEESVLGISQKDLVNEFADISSCETQTIVDNTLFLANTSAYIHDYQELQKLSWMIYPKQVEDVSMQQAKADASGKAYGYYDMSNVYHKVGYWPDEYYRFGIVYIYDNNQLSPVFNIQGYDASKTDDERILQDIIFNKIGSKFEFQDYEPDDYFFNKEIFANSKGVFKFKKSNLGTLDNPTNLKIEFVIDGIAKYINSLNISEYLFQKHKIKGFFFVRQKRIPTVIAQGIVVGLTDKDNGCLPILKDGNTWCTKSFLNNRLVLPKGSTQYTNNAKPKALLIPDAELQEATFNQIFTGQEFTLIKDGSVYFNIDNEREWWNPSSITSVDGIKKLSKLTAVPKDTKLITDGSTYFSSIAGSAEEPYKTEDIVNIWNKTVPQDLTVSNTLIRGKWGYYVGMGSSEFEFGDLVSIKKAGFYKDEINQNLLEFQERFSDYSLYSPISSRFNIDQLNENIQCFGGDCFPSLFTHRMMQNFIDPELPTNNKIVDPGCWAKNYAVRCTAEILEDTHSNLTGDSGGFYIPSPQEKTSQIVSLIFGILTGNLGTIINSSMKLAQDTHSQTQQEFANEIATSFEIYTGVPSPTSSEYTIDQEDWYTNGIYDETDTLYSVMKSGKIKKVNPKEQEQNSSGINIKALFKSDDKWELHGTAQINRADINAVSFGQWITFPIRSSMNIALRDIDFNQVTEEVKFSKKRSFYPLSKRDVFNKIPESNVINGATKKTVHKNTYVPFKTVPFIKQEYFNRIYWSKPNTSESFINSYRMIFSDQYKEYNKEFGAITKILPLQNSLFVVFDHGLGIVPVDRTAQTEQELSPYLASRNVLRAQVTAISNDYGSSWKNSVIKTPNGLIYGVDTSAKKIWMSEGQNVNFISDHYISKFLNDFIKLSEFDKKAYQGHIDVKTHYNNFKRDVIFTFVKDIPVYILTDQTKEKIRRYCIDVLKASPLHDIDITLNSNSLIIVGQSQIGLESFSVVGEIQNGLVYINDLSTGIIMDIQSWEPGIKWSICYNEVLKKWTTFYDWYPVESCNIDNIYFSFDQDCIDDIYENTTSDKFITNSQFIYENKFFIDSAFNDKIKQYCIEPKKTELFKFNVSGNQYVSMYSKGDLKSENLDYVEVQIPMNNGWQFTVYKLKDQNNNQLFIVNDTDDYLYIAQPNMFNFNLTDEYKIEQEKDPILRYYNLRSANVNRMYLWKHGQGGLYDNQGKIKPTHWYGKQHEFNFEFVVNENPVKQKIFNNLKILANKAAPAKFEYEVVGEGYEWFEFKSIVEWINKKAKESFDLDYWYLQVLDKNSETISAVYSDFPSLYDESRVIKKLPYLKMKHTDKKGTPERPHYKWDGGQTYWSGLSSDIREDRYSYNCSEPCFVEDDQLNETRIRTEQLGNDMKKYGRIRGNMQYLEDLWDVEIRPVQITWCYKENDKLKFKKLPETRHRDKYIKVKVRYSGEDLAVIQQIYTIFEESYA